MAEEQEKKQPVHKGGQPKLPGDNPKPPKRVVRTYQEDLARMSKNLSPEELKKQSSKEKEQPKKKEGLVTPPKPPKKEDVTKPPEPQPAPKPEPAPLPPQESLDAETKKHYVEEIRDTESIEISKDDAFTKEDLEHVSAMLDKKPAPRPATPKAPMPKPVPMPAPKKEQPAVIMEDASAPQQNIFARIMAWLLGGTGNDTPQAPQTQAPQPVAPPKKLESIPVVPKAPERTEEPIAPKKEEAPKPPTPEPAPAPKPAPEPKPEPRPAPTPPSPPLPQQEAPKKNPLFAAPQPREEKPIAPITPPRPERRPEDIPAPSPLQTYTSDAREGISKQKATPLSVLAKQQDAKKAPPKKQQPKKPSPLPLIAGGIALMVVGIGIVIGTYAYLQPAPAPQPTSPRIVTPVFAEDRVRVSANGTPTISAIGNLLSDVPAPSGDTITHITFTDNTGALIPFSDVLLNSNGVPGVLARAVYPQSMFGVYGPTKEPVAVLAVSSFERSFRSLLSWEDEMAGTLAPLFGTLNTTQVGTTTPQFVPEFLDEEVGPTDTRILYDAAGNPHIIYGFIDANLLFITKSKEAFESLRERIVRE